jgi:DNA-binding GntR family transcriptional regulator
VLDSKTRLPLYIQVKDYLIGLTASGVYPPGTKLPTENALMDTR